MIKRISNEFLRKIRATNDDAKRAGAMRVFKFYSSEFVVQSVADSVEGMSGFEKSYLNNLVRGITSLIKDEDVDNSDTVSAINLILEDRNFAEAVVSLAKDKFNKI